MKLCSGFTLTASLVPNLLDYISAETLGIEGNELTGAIPTELGRATALGELLRDYDCYACCV